MKNYSLKRILILSPLLIISLAVFSQVPTKIKPLTVGDKMPDVQITNIVNCGMKKAKISDFRGKVIILDFWSSSCSACLNAFPEMNSLQHRFSKNIQILLVNYKNEWDTDYRINVAIKVVKEDMIRPFNIPIVKADTALTRYFEFNTMPHCVWIDQQGKIIAITDNGPVNAANLEKVIRGEHINLPIKTLKILN